jgi:hypothetical protein
LVEPQAFLGFNVGGHVFTVHTRKLVDRFWMKFHENDFNRTITVVKKCCINATQTLIFELQWWFPKQEIMMAFGIMYLQYW